MNANAGGAFLIVNADDYGYFHSVSKGILRAAQDGIVTATGVLANSRHFVEHVAWLRDFKALDVGVHLNITEGTPLTEGLRTRFARDRGRFPRKFAIAAAVLSGRLGVDLVRHEWRAQIERCLDAGLSVTFLNSHEHLHMLPPLFSLTRELAQEYAIAHIRLPTSRFFGAPLGLSIVRDLIIKALASVNRGTPIPAPRFLGMEVAGKLTSRYLEEKIPQLHAGQVYEVMCHPGELDEEEVRDSRLRRYHDWEGELLALTSPAVRRILDRHGVRLVGYRHVEVRDNRIVVRPGNS